MITYLRGLLLAMLSPRLAADVARVRRERDAARQEVAAAGASIKSLQYVYGVTLDAHARCHLARAGLRAEILRLRNDIADLRAGRPS